VIRHLLRAGAALAALALTLAAVTAAAASPPPRLTPPRSYYLALGDSVAYGFQTSKALAGLPPEAFNTGYADLFAARLAQLQPRIATVNYFLPLASRPPHSCCRVSGRHPGMRCTTTTPGSQLDAALAFLAAHRGQVSPITLSLNGNDANDFLHTCPPGDLACNRGRRTGGDRRLPARLTSILRLLRALAPDAEIIVVGAYDPNLGAFAFADPLFTPAQPGTAGSRRHRAGTVRRPLPRLQPARRRHGRNHSDLHAHPALHRRGRPSLRPPATARSPTSSGAHRATRHSNDPRWQGRDLERDHPRG